MARALVPQRCTCSSFTAALAFSTLIAFASPPILSAEMLSVHEALEAEVLEQEALEKVSVAFAMMAWLPRLEGACELVGKGFLPSLNCLRLIAFCAKAMALKTRILKRLKYFRG